MALLSIVTVGCSMLPSEFNLSPIYRQRLDEQGDPLEVDALWPLFHYERTPSGGDDFRIRPIYRLVQDPEERPSGAGNPYGPMDKRLPKTEHQFLWPLGRYATDEEESDARFFPLWSNRFRINTDGQWERDWYFFPFVWGGNSESGAEDYLAVLPIYFDVPQWLTWDRVRMVLLPAYVGTEKQGRKGHIIAWPFIGWGGRAERDADGTYGDIEELYWYRILPLFAHDSRPNRYSRTWLPWPFIHWATENKDTNPVDRWWVWPLFSRDTGEEVDGWSVFWPFFQKYEVQDIFYRLDFPWPFVRYQENRLQDNEVTWWFWPLLGRSKTDRHDNWSALWPLIWWRHYDDPEGTTDQQWVLPFYWHVRKDLARGVDDYHHVFPLWSRERRFDGSMTWSFPSPWWVRGGLGYGVDEAYGWLWTLARRTDRAPNDRAFELMANLYTSRTRGERVQTSVPFLFSYEGDTEGGTLWLLQCIPIPWWGTEPEPIPESAASRPAGSRPATTGTQSQPTHR